MSGGHYNYAYAQVQAMASTMQGESEELTPAMRYFAEYLFEVAEAMRAVEWARSGDTDPDDADKAIGELVGGVDLLDEGLYDLLRRAPMERKDLVACEMALGDLMTHLHGSKMDGPRNAVERALSALQEGVRLALNDQRDRGP